MRYTFSTYFPPEEYESLLVMALKNFIKNKGLEEEMYREKQKGFYFEKVVGFLLKNIAHTLNGEAFFFA